MSQVFDKLNESHVLSAYIVGFTILIGLLFFHIAVLPYFIIAFSISIPLFLIAGYKMLLNKGSPNKA